MAYFLQMMYQSVFGKQRIAACESVDDSAVASVSSIPTKKKYSKNPWLLLPFSNPGAATKSLEFYDVIDNELHTMDLPMHIVQERGGARVCGSAKGWLIIVANETQLLLFNPLSGDQHELPRITSIPRFYDYRETVLDFINHVDLSSDDPSDPDFMVAAICGLGSVLACCRPKDKNWTVLTWKDIIADHDRSLYSGIRYISFCYHALYVGTTSKTKASPLSVVTAKDYTMNLDDGQYELKLKVLPNFISRYEHRRIPELRVSGDFGVFEGKLCKNYMVESNNANGELIFVSRFYDEVFQLQQGDELCCQEEEEEDGEEDLYEVLQIEFKNKNYAKAYQRFMKIRDNTMRKAEKRLTRKRYIRTSSFKVWKLVLTAAAAPDDNSFTIERVESLGDDAILYLGGGSAFIHSLSAAADDDDKKDVPVRGGNCIFFTDDHDYRRECCQPYVSRETGVFYLEDGRIERHFPSINLAMAPNSRMFWISPNTRVKCSLP